MRDFIEKNIEAIIWGVALIPTALFIFWIAWIRTGSGW